MGNPAVRPKHLLLLCCALVLVATPSLLHAHVVEQPQEVAAVSVTPSYTGPTTDYHAELVSAIEAAQRANLDRFYTEVARRDAERKAAAKRSTPRPTATTSGGSHRGYATARECVSMVEHGGSYDASSNPTHKGRYQFSRSAWISFGGIPEHWDDWSLASPAEQDAVFNNAWSQGPAVQTQQWLRWDGCGPADGS